MQDNSPRRFRELMERFERMARSIETGDRTEPTIERIAAGVTEALGSEMGFTGGRIYLREDNSLRVWRSFGAAPPVARGTVVPLSYEPARLALRHGVVYARKGDERLDPELEARLGAEGFAAAVLGDDDRYLLAFDVLPDHDPDVVIFSMELLRHFINDNIRQERIEDILDQARRIQASILPQQAPRFGDFDIAGRQDPLETVGGDFYDCLPVSDKVLGLAIADASGHGLPAAMQVRDIYTGLRMAVGRDFKIVRTVERLNQIINLSALSGRFVSLFYGELETSGTFIYCNAGHPPPIHVTIEGEIRLLEEGGVVLGPLPNAVYTRGFLTLKPGELIVFYTDGIVDTLCDCDGELDDYGAERLAAVAAANRKRSAAEIVEAIFHDVEAYCDRAVAEDDRTVAVVRFPKP